MFPDGTSYSGQYMKKGESIAMHGDGFLQSGPETFEDRNLSKPVLLAGLLREWDVQGVTKNILKHMFLNDFKRY